MLINEISKTFSQKFVSRLGLKFRKSSFFLNEILLLTQRLRASWYIYKKDVYYIILIVYVADFI